jgi:PAS domain S-box-containing protein
MTKKKKKSVTKKKPAPVAAKIGPAPRKWWVDEQDGPPRPQRVDLPILTRELRRQSRVFMEGADPIFIEDLNGRIADCNLEVERVYGWSRQELPGKPALTLVSPKYHEYATKLLARCRQGETIRSAESLHITKHGQEFPVLITLSLLRDETGQPEGIATIVKIITRIKQADAEKTRELHSAERRILEIAAEEQRRIGQDLHDSVGQELTAVSLLADNLARSLTAQQGPQAAALRKIAAGVKRAQAQVRELSRGLMPVEVDPEGLMAALADLARRTGDSGVICVFLCSEPVLVEDNNTATNLYRIAQEAVNNSIRHGKAKNIHISLFRINHRIALEIKDDGAGIKEADLQKQGMGLMSLRYRADLIHGQLRIEPGLSAGTAVSCVVEEGNREG